MEELEVCIELFVLDLYFTNAATAVPPQEIFVEHLRYSTNNTEPMYFDLVGKSCSPRVISSD